ncbi:MAG: YbhB/YbcL family Raf kinase inhibitor-like protein [Planctomycetota bacterium]
MDVRTGPTGAGDNSRQSGKRLLVPTGVGAAALLWLALVPLGLGCGGGEGGPAAEKKGELPMTIAITSTAFKAQAAIPKKHTGEGADTSPPLAWSGVPAEAKELALICDDPDAPRAEPWVHWVLYSLPAGAKDLPEGVPAKETLQEPQGARNGVNDFGKLGYGGPMPPRGHGTHHYYFKLYALDAALNLAPRLTKKKLLEALKGHILAQGELIGTYERK